MTDSPPPIGNKPTSYYASLRRSSALNAPPSAYSNRLSGRRSSWDEHMYDEPYFRPRTRSGSMTDLNPPNPPFANTRNAYRDSTGSDGSWVSDSGEERDVYRNSAAGNLVASQSSPNVNTLNAYPVGYRGQASPVNFRPAFLSPASRPGSVASGAWVPPPTSYAYASESPYLGSGVTSATGSVDALGSSTALPGLRNGSRNASRTNIRPSTLLVRDGSSVPNSTTAPTLDFDAAGDTSNEKAESKAVALAPSTGYNNHPLPRTRTACYLTLLCILLGVVGAALVCFTGVQETRRGLLDEKGLCLVLDEDWSTSGGGLDESRWGREVELGGFGNGEFQMTTKSDKNVFVKNGELYLMPTLTSEEMGEWEEDGSRYVLDGCTAAGVGPVGAGNATTSGGGNTTTTNGGGGNETKNANTTDDSGNGDENEKRWIVPRQQQRPPATSTRSSSSPSPSPSSSSNSTTSPPTISNSNVTGPGRDTNPCIATTNYGLGTVINPVQSGRVSTRGKVKGVRYGRVEVVARVGRGDWLWPAIWMLPENNTYGAWPLSGEIDIMEARGNAPSYPAQGLNYVRSSLNYGLSKGLVPIAGFGGVQPEPLTKQLYGWFSLKRTSFDKAFHTYAVEWDEEFMRFYVDSRVKVTLDLRISSKKGKNGKEENYFWNRGKFPPTAQNATDGQVVVVQNPWEGGGKNAPFDQKFYLIIDHAVGGTSGWFPDEVGGKPWYDGSQTAMRDFARARDVWYKTWGVGEDERAFRIKSVKMWSRDCE